MKMLDIPTSLNPKFVLILILNPPLKTKIIQQKKCFVRLHGIAADTLKGGGEATI